MKKKKILIVEDNPSNLKLFKFILEPVKCNLIEAYDGEEALKIAKEEKPDIILMDIQIPKMDGLEVTRQLRRTDGFKDTPIIALTAFAMDRDEKAGLDAGCSDYLTKPFNTEKLMNILGKYL